MFPLYYYRSEIIYNNIKFLLSILLNYNIILIQKDMDNA